MLYCLSNLFQCLKLLISLSFNASSWLKSFQDFIQALLPTAVFHQRFSFFTVYLSKYLMRCFHGGHQRETFWSLGLQIARKFISDSLSDWRSIACTLFFCSGSDFSWTLEFHVEFYETEFYNSIQDWVFTTVYRL